MAGAKQSIRNGILENDLNLNGFGFLNFGGLPFGNVTSVGLSAPGSLFSVSGSPVTTSGTLALSLVTQTANKVLAGPASGGAATPTMRTLVAADVPSVLSLTKISNLTTNGFIRTSAGDGTLAITVPTLTGSNLLTLTNPVATGYVKIGNDLDNTVTVIPPGTLLTDIGAQPSSANLTSWAALTRASGFDTFVATPSSANLAALLTDEISPVAGSKVILSPGALNVSVNKQLLVIDNIRLLSDGSATTRNFDIGAGGALSDYQPINPALTSWAAITRASGFDTFTTTPTLANLKALVTDETTVGWSFLTLANPDAVRFPVIEANNTVSARTVGSYVDELSLVVGENIEAWLGNPATDGFVLSSTTSGVRSWISNSAVVTWGGITGTLSNQTDLQSALNLKANLISPSFTTPSLGVATATSINGLEIDPLSSGGSLLIAGNGIVEIQGDFAVSGGYGVTLNATALTSVTLPTSGTLLSSTAIGSTVQAWDTDLDTWATKTPYAGALTITTGKTLNVTNTLTLSGTDSSALNIGAGGTLGSAAFINTGITSGTIPLRGANGLLSSPDGTQLFDNSGFTGNGANLTDIVGDDTPYNATTWNNTMAVASKNALRDKFETLRIGTDIQAYDADLTTWAGLTPSANAQSLVTAADYAAMRTLLGLVIGTNIQAYDADLTTWAGITPGTGVGTALAVNVGSAGAFLLNNGSAANLTSFPTLNQNTTGSAASLTTARNINGVSFNGTANITVPAAGSTLSDTVPVAKGGTGATTLAAHGLLVGNGTSAVAITGAGTTGQVLTSNGASADPTFQDAAGGGITNSAVENEIPKTDGSGNLVSSIVTDDGTYFTALRTGSIAGLQLNDDSGIAALGDVAASGNGTAIVVRDSQSSISLEGIPSLRDFDDVPPGSTIIPVGWIKIKLNSGTNVGETAWIPYYQ